MPVTPTKWFSVQHWIQSAWLLALTRLGRGLLVLLLPASVWGQIATQSKVLPPHFLPKSPTVSLLGRFDAQQLVNLPTGAAQLAIPLAEVSSGSLRLPVSLAYSYTGMKVYQPRDLVGLGWSLQAGATISLQVVGRLDNSSSGLAKYNLDSVSTASQAFLKRATANQSDTGPDIYSFAIPGGASGRFIIRDTTIVMLPPQPVHIRRVLSGQTGNSFQLSTEDGVRYLFQATEQTHPSNKFSLSTYTSAWHLTQMISADNADTLRLYYTKSNLEAAPIHCAVTTGHYNKTNSIMGNTVGTSVNTYQYCSFALDYTFENQFTTNTQLSPQYLDSITVRGQHLIFLRQAGTHVLKSARLFATAGERREIKRITLFQSEFPGGATSDVRVRLDSLQEGAPGFVLPPYRFRYNMDRDLPTRSSSGVDYWGYSNGALLNGDINNPTVNCLLVDPLLGANQAAREPVFSSALAGALEQVIYPTSGRTRWEYEPSLVWYASGTGPPIAHDSIYIDDPKLSYTANSPRNFDISTTSIPHYVTPSDTVHFQVLTLSDILVYLSRTPHSVTNPKPLTNRYKDFDIWRCLPSGDTLITRSTANANGDFKAFDPNDLRKFLFRLEPGTYAIRVYCEEIESATSTRIAIYDGRVDAAPGIELPAAGIRVYRTRTTTPGAPALVHTYEYALPDSLGGHSSGVEVVEGRRFSSYEFREVHDFNETCITGITSSDNTITGDEFARYPFYYSRVVVRDSSDNGAVANEYGLENLLANDIVLLSRQVFRQNAQHQLRVAQQDQYVYMADSLSSFPVIRAHMVQHVNRLNVTTPIPVTIQDQYEGQSYLLTAAYNVPRLTLHSTYDAQDRAFTTSTRSYYLQQRLVRTTTSTSTGWQIQRVKRLSDYAPTSAVTALRVNSFNPIIETQTWHHSRTSPDSVLVGGHLTLYHPAWRAPASLYELRLNQPQSGPNQESLTNGKYTGFWSDSRYERQDTVRYATPTGDIVQQQSAYGLPTSYLMGYAHTLVIAQAKNAAFAQIAATSFEPASTGRWQYDSTGTHRVNGGRTGRYAYQLDATAMVARPRLLSGDYELTYWAQDVTPTIGVQGGYVLPTWPQTIATAPGNWRHYRARVRLNTTGQISLSGLTGKLDELRLYPVGAQLTSYTHDPLVGITSQTDPDGRTLFYEYDALGRLVRTRDEQGRILSQQQYHYAGQ